MKQEILHDLELLYKQSQKLEKSFELEKLQMMIAAITNKVENL